MADKLREIDKEIIHSWFGLSYASYMVLPRTMLQSMPNSWQRKFIKLVGEMDNKFGHHNKVYAYTVLSRNEHNKSMQDELKNYERGRRRLIPKIIKEL